VSRGHVEAGWCLCLVHVVRQWLRSVLGFLGPAAGGKARRVCCKGLQLQGKGLGLGWMLAYEGGLGACSWLQR
jgi:hypothetical protein